MGTLSNIIPAHLIEDNDRLDYWVTACDKIIDGYTSETIALTASGSPALIYTGTFTVTLDSDAVVEIGTLVNGVFTEWGKADSDGLITGSRIASGSVVQSTGYVSIILNAELQGDTVLYAREHLYGIKENINDLGSFYSLSESTNQPELLELLGIKLKFTLDETWADADALTRYLENLHNVLLVKGTEAGFLSAAYFLTLVDDFTVVPLYSEDYEYFTGAQPSATDMTGNGGTWFATPHFRILVGDSAFALMGSGNATLGRKIWGDIFKHLDNFRPVHTVMSWGIVINIYADDDKNPVPMYVSAVTQPVTILNLDANATIPDVTNYIFGGVSTPVSGGLSNSDRGIWLLDSTGLLSKELDDASEHAEIVYHPSASFAASEAVYISRNRYLYKFTYSGTMWSYVNIWNLPVGDYIRGIFEVDTSRYLIISQSGSTWYYRVITDLDTTPGAGTSFSGDSSTRIPYVAYDGSDNIAMGLSMSAAYFTYSANNGSSWNTSSVPASIGNGFGPFYVGGAFYIFFRKHDGTQWRWASAVSTDYGATYILESYWTSYTASSSTMYGAGIVIGNYIYLVVEITGDIALMVRYTPGGTWDEGSTIATSASLRSGGYLYHDSVRFWAGIVTGGTNKLYTGDSFDGSFSVYDGGAATIESLVSIYV